MKFFFLFGGLLGFATATAAGLSAGRLFDRVLLDAALAAVAGALLFRWLWSVVLGGYRAALADRQRAAQAALAAAQQAAASPVSVKTTK